jgi:hypothetical protein
MSALWLRRIIRWVGLAALAGGAPFAAVLTARCVVYLSYRYDLESRLAAGHIQMGFYLGAESSWRAFALASPWFVALLVYAVWVGRQNTLAWWTRLSPIAPLAIFLLLLPSSIDGEWAAATF